LRGFVGGMVRSLCEAAARMKPTPISLDFPSKTA
jgi:hypothetical protein